MEGRFGIGSAVFRVSANFRMAFLTGLPDSSSGVSVNGGFVSIKMISLLACFKWSTSVAWGNLMTVGKYLTVSTIRTVLVLGKNTETQR